MRLKGEMIDMIINVERNYNPTPRINNEYDYINKIGVRKFTSHFGQYKPKDYKEAVKTAPGSALAFMVESYFSDDIPETRLLISELTRRLCKDEAEYKKYFSAETCEG